MPNPIVFEHIDALGDFKGKPVRASTLNATAIILTALGADRILVPAPGAYEKNRVTQGLGRLPHSRRGLVSLADADGKVLTRVMDFLSPLNKQAMRWPENTFVGFAVEMLYNLAVGCKEGATIVSDAMNHMFEFIPVIDPNVFSGEARYRLAELVLIASRYDPSLVFKSEIIGQVSEANIRNLFWKIIDSTEYSSVVSVSGRLGLVRHPAVLLRKLQRSVRDLTTRAEFRVAIKAGEVAADLAKFPVSLSNLGDLIGKLKRGPGFAPPFIQLPISTEYQIAKASLEESFPGAKFPKGTIYASERILGSSASHMWLNRGEDWKLEYNPQKTLMAQEKSAFAARKVAVSLGKGS